MPLDLATLLSLAPACAPTVAPATLLAVAWTESGFDPLAIGVNGPKPLRLTFADRTAAAKTARRLLAEGRDFDLGLAQINVRNLASLDLTLESAFDPCRNLAASAQVLQAGFTRAAPGPGQEQAGLRTALSYYNTGRADRGFQNGYVARVEASARVVVPAIATAPPPAATPHLSPASTRPSWKVFGGPPTGQGDFFFKPGVAP